MVEGFYYKMLANFGLANLAKEKKFQSANIKYFIFFILGCLFVLSFPPYNYFILIIFSINGFALLLKSLQSIKELIISLLSFSAGICILGMYWIYYATEFIFYSAVLSGLLFLGFIGIYALLFLPTGLLIFLARHKNGWGFIFTTIVAWAIYEIMKLHFIGGFPWFVMAQLWDFNIYMLQIVSVIGVFGYSILTIAIIAIFLLWLPTKEKIPYKLPVFLFFMGLLGLIFAFGYIKLNYSSVKEDSSYNLKVRLVETVTKQEDKLSYYKINDIFNHNMNLAFAGLDYDNPPDYIILPEVAFNVVLEDYPQLFQQIKNKIPSKTILLMGVLRRDDGKYYNSFYAISGKTKEVLYVYDKVRLVPFGEYIPFANLLPFIETFVGLSGLTKGQQQTIFYDTSKSINTNKNNTDSILTLPVKHNQFADNNILNQSKHSKNYDSSNVITTDIGESSLGLIPLICFEGVFPVDMPKESPYLVLLNISNEAWFKQSVELKQNVSLFRLRVLESGVLGIKVANYGSSAIVSSNGEFIYKNNNQAGVIFDTNLTVNKKNNIYHNILCIILYIIVFFCYLCLIIKLYLKK